MVQVISRISTPRFPGKTFNHRKNYMTHDEEETCNVGDKVMIQKSRPYSKRKHWKVVEIVAKNPVVDFLREHPEYIVSRKERKAGYVWQSPSYCCRQSLCANQYLCHYDHSTVQDSMLIPLLQHNISNNNSNSNNNHRQQINKASI
jgi:small subunit ribosomal protein S17